MQRDQLLSENLKNYLFYEKVQINDKIYYNDYLELVITM